MIGPYDVLVIKPGEEDMRVRVERCGDVADEDYYNSAVKAAELIRGQLGDLGAGSQVNVVNGVADEVEDPQV